MSENSNRADAKQRSETLKRLRTEHKETVERAREMLKEQKAVRSQICKSTREGPKTVPEIAEITGISPHEVLWHITAMKKYGLMAETEMCGKYYLYQLVKEQ
jgi:DNA-binding CsgD family transcriptional regulator